MFLKQQQQEQKQQLSTARAAGGSLFTQNVANLTCPLTAVKYSSRVRGRLCLLDSSTNDATRSKVAGNSEGWPLITAIKTVSRRVDYGGSPRDSSWYLSTGDVCMGDKNNALVVPFIGHNHWTWSTVPRRCDSGIYLAPTDRIGST